MIPPKRFGLHTRAPRDSTPAVGLVGLHLAGQSTETLTAPASRDGKDDWYVACMVDERVKPGPVMTIFHA